MNERNGRIQPKLPVTAVLVEAVKFFWSMRWRLFVALVASTSAMLIIGTFLLLNENSDRPDWLITLVLWIANGVFFTIFAVSCHRITLIGPDAVPRFGQYRWSARETRFFLWMGACYATLFGISGILLTFEPGSDVLNFIKSHQDTPYRFVVYVALLPGFYVFARLLLLLPAIALDKAVNLRWAWSTSRYNGWRLVFALGVVPFLTDLALLLVHDIDNFIIKQITLAVWYAIHALDIVILSLSYRYLSRSSRIANQT